MKNIFPNLLIFILLMVLPNIFGLAQTSPNTDKTEPLPVFDVHWHFPGKEAFASNLEAMKALNVKNAVLIGTYSQLSEAKPDGSIQSLPALTFPCENGKMVNIGTQCFEDGKEFPDLNKLREQIKSGNIKVLAELNAQYLGIAPNDSRLEPYFALAEELNVPVGLHLGIGPPAVAYKNKGFPPVKSPNYRGSAGNPMLLEDVLIKHPKLKIYAMHAAYPFRDEMIYMLYMHPQLFVDISVLQWAIPRPAYYSYLRSLVEAGFAKRIMFGSDGNTTRLKEGIQAIMDADFLTAEQKSDILYNNAAKFFQVTAEK
ncbi:MAG TPA: amidohydrolase family protein [Pyrinomonadaceae bacterium]|nr:amidohydrolase family protein [Pyrinomonadaceae bacterium]